MYESELNRTFLIGFCPVAMVENNGARDWHFFVCFCGFGLFVYPY